MDPPSIRIPWGERWLNHRSWESGASASWIDDLAMVGASEGAPELVVAEP
jgi:hypothetical protein